MPPSARHPPDPPKKTLPNTVTVAEPVEGMFHLADRSLPRGAGASREKSVGTAVPVMKRQDAVSARLGRAAGLEVKLAGLTTRAESALQMVVSAAVPSIRSDPEEDPRPPNPAPTPLLEDDARTVTKALPVRAVF